MPNLNIDELMDDPDFVTPGLVFYRSTVVPQVTGQPLVSKNRYPFQGTVSPMKVTELQRMPEGFNTTGAISIITTTKLNAGNVKANENPDQILYKGNLYLVTSVDDFEDWGEGFIVAFCQMQGSNVL